METHVGFYFKKISERLERRANEERRDKDNDITYAQGRVLWYLHKHADEKVSMCDIRKYFDCAHATIFGLIKKLEEKGRVYLEPDETDRRAKVVKITELEKKNFQEVKNRRLATEQALLKGFSEEEKEAVTQYLERIYNNLE